MDRDLEMAIEAVGREDVFARARRLGWTAGQPVPKWVWWGIITELRNERAALAVLATDPF